MLGGKKILLPPARHLEELLEHWSESIRLTVSQSVRQAGRQAVNEAGWHAGRNTQPGFFVSACEEEAQGCSAAVQCLDRLAGRGMVYPSAILQTRVQTSLSPNF